MARAFSEIAFTPTVRALQSQMGSRGAYAAFDHSPERHDRLGPAEAAFIAERDSFYQATVSETGWPYLQHRGGPVGFLRLLDARTLAFADFRGNRQYISQGNLAGNDRIALFLMDYANQRRLKILGRVRVISEDDEPEIVAALTPPGYPARAEHAFVIQVEAYDWNCPQHITPRLTREEWDVLGISAPAPLAAPAAAAPTDVWGDGPLALVVSGVRQLATRVRAYELRAVDGGDLPPVGAGSHLDVPVRLADGRTLTRSYSIASNPARRDIYEIAVQHEEAGRGGSRAIHASLQLGQRLNVAPPRNHFALHSDARPALLIAGGIGITPLKAMAQSLLRDGREFALHYIGRSAAEMPYLDRLRRCLGERMHAWLTRQTGAAPLDLAAIVEGAGDAVIYVCGPRRLVDEVRRLGTAAGIAAERIIDESFA